MFRHIGILMSICIDLRGVAEVDLPRRLTEPEPDACVCVASGPQHPDVLDGV